MVASSASYPNTKLQRHGDTTKQAGIAWTPACGSASNNNRHFRHHVSANGGGSGFLDGAKAVGILEADDVAGVATSGNFALTLEARCEGPAI